MKVKILLIIILILAGCQIKEVGENMKEITLKTSDGVTIKGNYLEGGSKGVLLLHRLNQDRHVYDAFAEQLNQKGYSVISIDFRGHGESEGRWKDFSEKDFRNMQKDALAAIDFLENKGKKETTVIGESIGANTALNIAATDKRVTKAVLLSPGTNYRGIGTETADKIKKPIMIVLAKDDGNYQSGKEVEQRILNQKETLEYETGGHGTQMFQTTDIQERIITWLQ